MTFKQYKLLDLIIMFILCLGAELVGELLFKKYDNVTFYITFSLLVTAIAVLRWGFIGSIVYIMMGLIMILLSFIIKLPFEKNAIYIYFLGNFGVLLIGFYLHYVKRERIIRNMFSVIIYYIVLSLSVVLGRTILLTISTQDFIASFRYVAGIMSFELFFSIIVLVVLRKTTPTIFVDAYKNLKRIKGQTESEE